MARLTLAQLNALWVNGYVPDENDYQDLFSTLRQDGERLNAAGPYDLDTTRVNRLIEVYGTTAATFNLTSGREAGDGFMIKNNSTQVITIDRNGQTLDVGAVDLSVGPGSTLLLHYTGANWASHFVGGGIFTLTTSKADATAVNLDNSNRFTHYEVTGLNAPTFSLTAGTAVGSMWRITNSNDTTYTTVVTVAENSQTTNLGGDLKLKPGESVDILHQGGNRFVLILNDAPVDSFMMIARSTGGSGATWSLLNDGGAGGGGNHLLEAPGGVTPAISVTAGSPNTLKITVGALAGRKVLGAIISPDETFMGVSVGHQINQDGSNFYLNIGFGNQRQRLFEPYFTWGGSSWTMTQGVGDFTGTLSANTASSITVAHPAGEVGGLHISKIHNSGLAYYAKPHQSINQFNTYVVMREFDGTTTPTPNTNDRVFVSRTFNGKGAGFSIDADDIPGISGLANIWIYVRMKKSTF